MQIHSCQNSTNVPEVPPGNPPSIPVDILAEHRAPQHVVDDGADEVAGRRRHGRVVEHGGLVARDVLVLDKERGKNGHSFQDGVRGSNINSIYSLG